MVVIFGNLSLFNTFLLFIWLANNLFYLHLNQQLASYRHRQLVGLNRWLVQSCHWFEIITNCLLAGIMVVMLWQCLIYLQGGKQNTQLNIINGLLVCGILLFVVMNIYSKMVLNLCQKSEQGKEHH